MLPHKKNCRMHHQSQGHPETIISASLSHAPVLQAALSGGPTPADDA
jgi:hypothetical protein